MGRLLHAQLCPLPPGYGASVAPRPGATAGDWRPRGAPALNLTPGVAICAPSWRRGTIEPNGPPSGPGYCGWICHGQCRLSA